MSKQWTMVVTIVAGLVLGAAALVRYGPKLEGIEIGKRAPDYAAVRLGTADSVSLREYTTGHVTLVNIWATWCVPCRAEMPAMEQLYKELGPKGLKIVAISIDEGSPADVRAFTTELGLTFDIWHDKSGDIQRVYQTTGVPESFLLDKNGVIVKKVIGEHPWSSPSNQRVVAGLLGGD
ncbi:MAG: TlpA family protein disulfide reductase [Gemmatimonadales bacterium]|nr:TlpA family protein disulfide reductase [Gemmatimonadales bacterium]